MHSTTNLQPYLYNDSNKVVMEDMIGINKAKKTPFEGEGAEEGKPKDSSMGSELQKPTRK